jgi:hypothetical protein
VKVLEVCFLDSWWIKVVASTAINALHRYASDQVKVDADLSVSISRGLLRVVVEIKIRQ